MNRNARADALKQLSEIGFKPVGSWALQDGELALVLDAVDGSRHALYAFVVDGCLKYIGKTKKTLRGRLHHYLKPASTQSTNIKNHSNIVAAIKGKRPVEIFALFDDGSRSIGAFHLNIAAGLEDSLIEILNPEWNGFSKSTNRVEKGASRKRDLPKHRAKSYPSTGPQYLAGLHPSHSLCLRPTYYKRGFFNAPKAAERYYGNHGDDIEIYCGSSNTPILGRVNRDSNTSGAPRIMGGVPLREWIQGNFEVNDFLSVDVLSKSAIRLTPVR